MAPAQHPGLPTGPQLAPPWAHPLSPSRPGPASLLFRAALVLALAWLTVLSSVAPLLAAHSPADLKAIEQVIRTQLGAFQDNDPALAFSLASPGIQARFGTADIFMRMVVTGYPAVFRPREVRFLDLEDLEGTPVQRVYLIGPDGRPYIAHYPMVRLEDGSWRIDGCVLTAVDASSA